MIERQTHEMTTLKRDLTDLKRLLAQNILQGQMQTSANLPSTNEGPVRDLPKSLGSSKPRNAHGKAQRKALLDNKHQDASRSMNEPGRSSSAFRLDSKHTAADGVALPGIDIRRQPAKEVALIAPRKEPGTNGSTC